LNFRSAAPAVPASPASNANAATPISNDLFTSCPPQKEARADASGECQSAN
jgi:hypothetical protein